MSNDVAIPGEKIAIIEEYESGTNTFDDGHSVRSTVIGTTEIDRKNRVIMAVSIEYINNKPTSAHIECICPTRNLRKKTVALQGDIVALKITSQLNGTNHATISEPELGVLFTRCRKCGGNVIQKNDAIKCVDCNWIEERKLSKNFGNNDFVKLRR